MTAGGGCFEPSGRLEDTATVCASVEAVLHEDARGVFRVRPRSLPPTHSSVLIYVATATYYVCVNYLVSALQSCS